jgi:hypothetical protein
LQLVIIRISISIHFTPATMANNIDLNALLAGLTQLTQVVQAAMQNQNQPPPAIVAGAAGAQAAQAAPGGGAQAPGAGAQQAAAAQAAQQAPQQQAAQAAQAAQAVAAQAAQVLQQQPAAVLPVLPIFGPVPVNDFQTAITVCGFAGRNHQVLYYTGNIVTPMDLRSVKLNLKAFQALEKKCEKIDGANFSPSCFNNLMGLRAYLAYWDARDLPMDATRFDPATCAAFVNRLDLLATLSLVTEDKKDTSLPPFTRAEDWRQWDRGFRNHLQSVRNSRTGQPLTYLLRTNFFPTQAALDRNDYRSIDEDLEATASLATEDFRTDNQRLFCILTKYWNDKACPAYFHYNYHSGKGDQDGRSCYLQIQQQFAGQVTVQGDILTKKKEWGNLEYTGKPNTQSLRKYSDRQIFIYNELYSLGETTSVTDRFLYYQQGIKDAAVRNFIATYLHQHPDLEQIDFLQFTNDLCAAIKREELVNVAAKSHTNRVLSAQRESGGGIKSGSSGSNRPTRDAKALSTKQQSWKTNQYIPNEYQKGKLGLTKAQKEMFQKLYLDTKGSNERNKDGTYLHGGHYTPQAFSSLSSEEQKLVKEMHKKLRDKAIKMAQRGVGSVDSANLVNADEADDADDDATDREVSAIVRINENEEPARKVTMARRVPDVAKAVTFAPPNPPLTNQFGRAGRTGIPDTWGKGGPPFPAANRDAQIAAMNSTTGWGSVKQPPALKDPPPPPPAFAILPVDELEEDAALVATLLAAQAMQQPAKAPPGPTIELLSKDTDETPMATPTTDPEQPPESARKRAATAEPRRSGRERKPRKF